MRAVSRRLAWFDCVFEIGVSGAGFILATMLLGAAVRGRRFRVYSLVTAGVVAVFGGLAGYLARPMPGPTPGIGLAERVNIYASMVWFAVLAAVMWRRPPQGDER